MTTHSCFPVGRRVVSVAHQLKSQIIAILGPSEGHFFDPKIGYKRSAGADSNPKSKYKTLPEKCTRIQLHDLRATPSGWPPNS